MAQETERKAKQTILGYMIAVEEKRKESLQAIIQKNAEAQNAEQAARAAMKKAEESGNYAAYADAKMEYEKAISVHEVVWKAYNQAKSDKTGAVKPEEAQRIMSEYQAETASLFSSMYEARAEIFAKIREIERKAYALQKEYRNIYSRWNAEIDPQFVGCCEESKILPEYIEKALINEKDKLEEYNSLFSCSGKQPEPIFDPALYGDHRPEEEKQGLVKVPLR